MRESGWPTSLRTGSEAESRQSVDATFQTQASNVQQGSGNVMNIHHHYERYHDTENEPTSGQVDEREDGTAVVDEQRTGKKIKHVLQRQNSSTSRITATELSDGNVSLPRL